MKSPDARPIQFHTNDGIGLRLINAATHKRLGAAIDRKPLEPRRPNPTGTVLKDILALGSQAFIAHVGQLLHKNPLQVVHGSDCITRIRVCGALDYAIDRTQQQVWTEPAPLTARERNATEQTPWGHPMNGKFSDFDVLNPLCKSMWLNYIAARPGWFGYAFSRHQGTQKQLFIENDEVTHALRMVIRAAWRHFCRDQAFIALRHQVATALTLHIGPSTINLAMQSRLRNGPAVLHAKHLNLVLRHQRAFAIMAHETPQMLTGLTAWLLNQSQNEPAGLTDAVPMMRDEMLKAGFPPQAWRYLVRHGFKRLQRDKPAAQAWSSVLHVLWALHLARWPALPPRRFLRLLFDVAGQPLHYEKYAEQVAPGWFWQITCDAAHACKSDTAEYTYLFDQIPEWAWMVRHYQLRPDKNQRRKGIAWLELMTDAMHSRAAKEDVPEWALWLPAQGWADTHTLNAVPLQSPGALVREAIALHNCTDAYTERCRSESHVMISLRAWGTEKSVGLVSVQRRGSNWVVCEVAGPCNQAASFKLRRLAQEACDWVRCHHSQRPVAEQNPPPDTDDDEFDDRLAVD
jgi:hypothetical protein